MIEGNLDIIKNYFDDFGVFRGTDDLLIEFYELFIKNSGRDDVSLSSLDRWTQNEYLYCFLDELNKKGSFIMNVDFKSNFKCGLTKAYYWVSEHKVGVALAAIVGIAAIRGYQECKTHEAYRDYLGNMLEYSRDCLDKESRALIDLVNGKDA